MGRRGRPPKLYHCPELQAWMTAAACDRNHETATSPAAGPRFNTTGNGSEGRRALAVGQQLRLAPCRGCPGIKSLARRAGALPPRPLNG